MTDDEKLTVLWEERAITAVMLKFGRSLDIGDWPGYRSCFTDEVLIDFERLTGVPLVKVRADDWTVFAEHILSPVRRHHSYSNFNITLQGDEAFAIVYMTARHWKSTDMGASEYNQFGWYDVWFRRVADGWKIQRIKHDFQWVSGNNALFDMTEPQLVAAMQICFSQTNIEAARDGSPGA